MGTEMYDRLIEKLPEIAEAVKVFEHPGLQERAVEALTRSLGVPSGSRMDPTETAGQGDASSTGESAGTGRPSQPLERVAAALGVSGERIELIYVQDGDGLQLAADPDVLGSSNQARVATVAALIAGGRQLAGWDEGSTADAVIRAEVDRLGLYDQTNYSKHMKEAAAWLNINGSGKSATFKLKHPGRQYLKQLAQRLTSGD